MRSALIRVKRLEQCWLRIKHQYALVVIVCSSESGKCLVTQPHFAASLSCISGLIRGESEEKRGCAARGCYWENNSNEHSDKSVAASQTNTPLLRASNIGHGFLVKESNSLSKML